jgi:DNA-binding transcriptional ArsR family regulator
VSKHLGILRSARLVRARARGREVHYTVDARPLREMYQEWLERFAPLWEQSLANLKRRVEEGNPPPGR